MVIKSMDGTVISYDVYGSGPTLIFITGAICHRKFGPVEKNAKILANEFTVYNYDRRGRGDSGDKQPYSVERELEDIEAIIDAAGGSANLYGHSSGGILALEAALRFPNKIKKIVVYEAPYAKDDLDKREHSKLKKQVGDLLSNKDHGEALRTFLAGIGMPKVLTYFLSVMPGWKKMKELAPTLQYDLLLASDMAPLDRLSQIKVPTYIVYGQKSAAKMGEVAKQLSNDIPGSNLSELEGQDHRGDSKAILPLLSKFLNGAGLK